MTSVLPLRMRDLRRLDHTINPNEELTIQIRQFVVLFIVDPLRSIVTSNKLRLVVPPGGDIELSILQHHIQENLIDKSFLQRNFELHMYEYLLTLMKH